MQLRRDLLEAGGRKGDRGPDCEMMGENSSSGVISAEAIMAENRLLVAQLVDQSEGNDSEEVAKLKLELQTKEPLIERLKERVRKSRYENQELRRELDQLKRDLSLTEEGLKKMSSLEGENASLKTKLEAVSAEYDRLVAGGGNAGMKPGLPLGNGGPSG